MIAIIGEILVDMIGENKNGEFCYLRKAGGAPFNVACALARFGGSAAFYGVVGDDLVGRYLEAFASQRGFVDFKIEKRPDRNTTLAFVDRDETGERNFCFYRCHTADAAFGEVPSFVKGASIVHFGTLMLSLEEGRAFAEAEIDAAKKRGQIVSLDVNFRDDVFPSKEEAIRIYKHFLEKADILKFSEDEVALFGEDYVSAFPEKIVLVTLGSQGSKMLYKGATYRAPSISVVPVDTTGAGDSFLGAFLSRIELKPFRQFGKKEWEDALFFANVAAALNTLSCGAIDGLPSLESVYAHMEEHN